MDWRNEGWVRLYRRNTPEWLAVPWQARSFFDELLKLAEYAGPDRGLVRLGPKGLRAIAGAVHWPPDVVEKAVDDLLEDGCVARVEGGLLIRNYVPAQEASKSNSLKCKDYRARKAPTPKVSPSTPPVSESTPGDTAQHRATPADTARPQEEEKEEEKEEEIPPTPLAGECSEPERARPASEAPKPNPSRAEPLETPGRPDASPGAAAGAPRPDRPSTPPEPATGTEEAEEGPPGPTTAKQRMAESKARIAGAFARGIRAAVGDPHFALLPREHDDLAAVVAARGKGPDGKRLVGPRLDAWLEAKAAEFARETRAESQFFGHGPRGFERWLRQKAAAGGGPPSGQVERIGPGRSTRRVEANGYVSLTDHRGMPVQGYDPKAPWLKGLLTPEGDPAPAGEDPEEARRAAG